MRTAAAGRPKNAPAEKKLQVHIAEIQSRMGCRTAVIIPEIMTAAIIIPVIITAAITIPVITIAVITIAAIITAAVTAKRRYILLWHPLSL